MVLFNYIKKLEKENGFLLSKKKELTPFQKYIMYVGAGLLVSGVIYGGIKSYQTGQKHKKILPEQKIQEVLNSSKPITITINNKDYTLKETPKKWVLESPLEVKVETHKVKKTPKIKGYPLVITDYPTTITN